MEFLHALLPFVLFWMPALMVIAVRLAIGNPPGIYWEEGGRAVYFAWQAGNAL